MIHDVERVVIDIIGAVIRNAIKDYRSRYLKEKRRILWEDAERFLFKDEELEMFLGRFELRDSLNCAYIRRMAKSRKPLVEDDQ